MNEIPENAELMSITAVNNLTASLTGIIWNHSNPGVDSVTKQSILNALHGDIGYIPFGNKKVWKVLQSSDPDCRTAAELLITGNVPTKKTRNRIINNLLQECTVNK